MKGKVMQFKIGNINFEYSGEYNRKSTVENIAILKKKDVIEYYSTLLPRDAPVTIFEIGVLEAGSAIALAAMNPQARVVGIDFTFKPHLDDIIAAHGLSDRIHLYHKVEQQNESRLRGILATESCGKPIDLVVDDASHMYGPSRESFEVLFPYLKRGGHYIIEDWNWAHFPGVYQTSKWNDQPALTNLVFELIMLAGSNSPDIERITISGISAVVTKCSEPNPEYRFNISAGIRMRNRALTLI
jgi:cephalosporin hydroxylase